MTAVPKKRNEALYYKDNYAHIADELRKLDLLIKRRVAVFRLKLAGMAETAASHTMYISHDEIDYLLDRGNTSSAGNLEIDSIDKELGLLQENINIRTVESRNRGIFLALPGLAHLFGLSGFELQIVVMCMAPELDRKYDKLYAYLQDDITRKKPSIDLALDLLCISDGERWSARTFFSGLSPLFTAAIIQKTDDLQSPSGSTGLSQFLKLDSRILGHLLNNNSMDARLADFVKFMPPLLSMEQVLIDPVVKTRLSGFINDYFLNKDASRKKLALYLEGPGGAGKKELAQGICGQLKCPLLGLDMELIVEEPNRDELLKILFREGLLLQSAIYLYNMDIVMKEDDRSKTFIKKLAKVAGEYGWLTFLSGQKPCPYKDIFNMSLFQVISIPVPDIPIRELAWKKALEQIGTDADGSWPVQLASQFHLTPGKISNAARIAELQVAMSGGQKNVSLKDLFSACRGQSNHKLAELALKIDPRYSWEDLVLPAEKMDQLKEICSQLKYRYMVFGQWGFGDKLSRGRGLSVLFSGPPGTGKTMAAEVIASQLNLDLYKIDLSGVVSKYIGETEKNLARVFQEAQTSNAILFFDEADALFGKRTKVNDAHDRYANIETSYLLQRMEEYEGMVILATNLRENMDDAFTRRIRFIVEFPFPDAANRMRIWQTHVPKQAPVSREMDYDFLSRQFQIAGGNIKNIMLNAAFLAAENGGVIGMDHVLHGIKREFEKIGKLWNEKNLYSPPDSRS